MKLEKAIQLLKFELKTYKDIHSPDTNDAMLLAIEALKRIKECRLADHTITEDLLPGETED